MPMKLIAAALAAALSLASAAQAATFAVTGGEAFGLSGYNPTPGAAEVPANATVLRNATLALADRGRVTFSYFGTEAGYTNQFWLDGAKRFDNKSGPNAPFTLTLDAGVLPFEFRTVSPSGTVANGGSSGFLKSIALYQTAPSTVFALFNDSANVDRDYDDMLVRIDVAPVPLPAAAWLLLGGMGAIGAVARRRKAA